MKLCTDDERESREGNEDLEYFGSKLSKDSPAYLDNGIVANTIPRKRS